MCVKIRYTITFIMILLLISQASAWTIIRQKEVSDISELELWNFLAIDQTDQIKYTEYFQCGHFARRLAINASYYNITLGGVTLSTNNNFMDYDNHAINYVYINGSIVFIRPQSDKYGNYSSLLPYKYYRLYPNGKYTPSRW